MKRWCTPLWRLWRVLPLPALLVAACAGQTGPCRLQPVANLTASLANNRLEVTGQVNGAATSLLLDTGAERTVLTANTVAALQLPRSQRSVSRLTGIGGAVSNADVFAVLALGHADFRERMAVADIAGFGGVVGGDMLSDYDLELDLPGHRVGLWHAAGCGASDLPWTGPRATIPVDVTSGAQLRLSVALDGQPIAALLDSGASTSLLQTDAARRLGVSPAALAADPGAVSRGVDGAAIGVRYHRFGALTVGAEQVAGARIGVAEFQAGDAQMLLGLDYLRTRRVWVAYRTGQIFVQGVQANGAGNGPTGSK